MAIGDIDLKAAMATAEQLGVRAYRLDVTDADCQDTFIAEVAGDLGPIDIFVSNAGLMWVGSFADEPRSATRAQIEVNLLGVINGIKAAAPAMLARGRGHLITVASAGSILPTPGEATYAATKHGVLGYLKAVRAEMRGSEVGVSVVMPVVVDTALAAGTSPGAANLLTPGEVARAVVRTAETRRFAVTVPAYIEPAVRVVDLLPTPVRDRIYMALVPDQVKSMKSGARRAYEAGFS